MLHELAELPGLALANFMTTEVSEFSGFAHFQFLAQPATALKFKTKLFCPTPVEFIFELQPDNLELWRCRFRSEDLAIKDNHTRAYCKIQMRNFVSPVLATLPALNPSTHTRTAAQYLAVQLVLALNRSDALKQYMVESFELLKPIIKIMEFRVSNGPAIQRSYVTAHWIGRNGSMPFHHKAEGFFQLVSPALQSTWFGGNKPSEPDEFSEMLITNAIHKYWREVSELHRKNKSMT